MGPEQAGPLDEGTTTTTYKYQIIFDNHDPMTLVDGIRVLMIIATRNVNFAVIFMIHLLQLCVGCCRLVGYAADPSVSDTNAPDTVIGDIQKFKEMKGLYFYLTQ